MAEVTMEDIKSLRESTGAGLADCKKALEESDGNIDKAIEFLRKKGAATAAKRAEREAKQGLVVSYIHNNRIGAMLELNCETDFVAKNKDFQELAKELVMHVAAADPLYVNREEVPTEVIEKEKEIEKETIDKSKPAEIQEKILEGKINKYFSAVCLMEQNYVKDPNITIGDLLNEKTAAIGEKLAIRRFARFELGK